MPVGFADQVQGQTRMSVLRLCGITREDYTLKQVVRNNPSGVRSLFIKRTWPCVHSSNADLIDDPDF